MLIDCSKASPQELYRILLGSVVPRPIAWVSTISETGVLNLAPFSFYNAFSANPPILGIGIGSRRLPDGSTEPKDSFKNIESRGEFVVNVVSRPLAEKMNLTSGEYEPSVNEFEVAGLTPAASTMVAPPRVEEALIAMECRLFQVVPLGGSNLVLGKIVCIHTIDEVWKQGDIDLERLEPVGRLNGSSYCDTSVRFEMPRPRH